MPARWSDHAAQRAAERLIGIDADCALASARPAGKHTRERIRQQCRMPPRRNNSHQRYYLVAPGNVVFVMQPPGVVVTVFTLRADARGPE